MHPDADARRKRIIRSSYSAETAGPPARDGTVEGAATLVFDVGEGRPSQVDRTRPIAVRADDPPDAVPHDGRSLAELSRWLAPGTPGRCTELILSSSLTGESEIVRVDSAVVFVGRDARCDLKLDHPDVSRKHACLHVLRDRVLCVDLCSRTGVFWGGERRRTGWLEPGRSIGIGPYELRLPADATPAAGDAAIDPERLFSRCPVDGPGGAALRLLTASGEVAREVRIGRAITLIGRGDRCTLRLPDASVSRVDSSLIVTPQGFLLTNLMGRGRVRVNGERLSSVRLSDGDELRVGRFRMRFAAGTTAGDTADATPAGTVESLPPGMSAVLSQLRREMTEQFRLQADLTVDLLEALRRDLTREIRTELFRLVEVAEEIRSARQRLAEADRGPSGPAPREAVDEPEPVIQPSRNGAADHALITYQLRELESERGRRWRNLVALIGPGA